jgi:hypothetical protein
MSLRSISGEHDVSAERFTVEHWTHREQIRSVFAALEKFIAAPENRTHVCIAGGRAIHQLTGGKIYEDWMLPDWDLCADNHGLVGTLVDLIRTITPHVRTVRAVNGFTMRINICGFWFIDINVFSQEIYTKIPTHTQSGGTGDGQSFVDLIYILGGLFNQFTNFTTLGAEKCEKHGRRLTMMVPPAQYGAGSPARSVDAKVLPIPVRRDCIVVGEFALHLLYGDPVQPRTVDLIILRNFDLNARILTRSDEVAPLRDGVLDIESPGSTKYRLYDGANLQTHANKFGDPGIWIGNLFTIGDFLFRRAIYEGDEISRELCMRIAGELSRKIQDGEEIIAPEAIGYKSRGMTNLHSFLRNLAPSGSQISANPGSKSIERHVIDTLATMEPALNPGLLGGAPAPPASPPFVVDSRKDKEAEDSFREKYTEIVAKHVAESGGKLVVGGRYLFDKTCPILVFCQPNQREIANEIRDLLRHVGAYCAHYFYNKTQETTTVYCGFTIPVCLISSSPIGAPIGLELIAKELSGMPPGSSALPIFAEMCEKTELKPTDVDAIRNTDGDRRLDEIMRSFPFFAKVVLAGVPVGRYWAGQRKRVETDRKNPLLILCAQSDAR